MNSCFFHSLAKMKLEHPVVHHRFLYVSQVTHKLLSWFVIVFYLNSYNLRTTNNKHLLDKDTKESFR